MLTDIGEFIVGAHLQLVEGCDVIDYNVRPPCGTEPAFKNKYWDNNKDGIYVDIVSGEPCL